MAASHRRPRLIPNTARRSISSFVRFEPRLAWRSLRRQPRLEPSLIIIGAMKGATTSVFYAFARHPAVAPPIRKEVHFFSLRWNRSRSWYSSHFPTVGEAGARLTLEASPSYISHPLAPERMLSVLPDVKIVVLLRDPVKRTLSHYFHSRRRGTEHRPLEAALADPRCDMPLAQVMAEKRGEAAEYWDYGYVAPSRYANELRPWFAAFGPDRIQVHFSEEYAQRPDEALNSMFAFVGLPPAQVNAGEARNRRAWEPYDTAIESDLRARFRDSNAELEALLKRPLPWKT